MLARPAHWRRNGRAGITPVLLFACKRISLIIPSSQSSPRIENYSRDNHLLWREKWLTDLHAEKIERVSLFLSLSPFSFFVLNNSSSSIERRGRETRVKFLSFLRKWIGGGFDKILFYCNLYKNLDFYFFIYRSITKIK